MKRDAGARRLEVRWPRRAVVWHPCIIPSRVGWMAGFGEEKKLCAPTPALNFPQSAEAWASLPAPGFWE